MNASQETRKSFGPLVKECSRHGIGKTTAFKLAKEGKLQTFKIGRRRYVLIESIDQLAAEALEVRS